MLFTSSRIALSLLCTENKVIPFSIQDTRCCVFSQDFSKLLSDFFRQEDQSHENRVYPLSPVQCTEGIRYHRECSTQARASHHFSQQLLEN